MTKAEGHETLEDWMYLLENKIFTWKKKRMTGTTSSTIPGRQGIKTRTLNVVRGQRKVSSLGWDSQGRLPGRGGI